MIEFASFCYLQNQKTGCTMVETFLRQHCSEDIVHYDKHKAPKQWQDEKFYFLSVREPLDTYLSLFNYGLDGKGELFVRLQHAGHGWMYDHGIDGFGDWLEFILDPAHAELSYPKKCGSVAPFVGLVSCRFLRLAVSGFEAECSAIDCRTAVVDFVESHRHASRVIHYETMQNDLMELVKGTLSHAFVDLPGALGWLAASPRINPSNRREKSGMELLTAAQRTQLVEREWYLYCHHYPEMAGALTP